MSVNESEFDKRYPQELFNSPHQDHSVKDGSAGWMPQHRYPTQVDGITADQMVNLSKFTNKKGHMTLHKHTGMTETIVNTGEKPVAVGFMNEDHSITLKELAQGESVCIPTNQTHTIFNNLDTPSQMLAIGVKTGEGQTVAVKPNFMFVPQVVNNKSIDLSQKDHDPRKTKYVTSLLRRHNVVGLWRKFGLMERIGLSDESAAYKDARWSHSVHSVVPVSDEKIKNYDPIKFPNTWRRHTNHETYERRKHFATEHMVTVALGSEALAQALVVKGVLEKEDVDMVVKAALLHDADKPLEMALTGMAAEEPFDVDKYLTAVKAEIRKYGVKNLRSFSSLFRSFKKKVDGVTDAGTRALAAFDLASSTGEKALAALGVDKKTAALQRMVTYNTCPEIEKMINRFDKLKGEKRREAIITLIIHYMDDGVVNPNNIDETIKTEGDTRLNVLGLRGRQNEANPKYFYNQAWKLDKRAKVGANGEKETAFQMQTRVAYKVQDILAGLLGVEDPLTLPQFINKGIANSMLNQ